MTIYELLKFMGEPLERLTNAGMKAGDYKYIALYEDYREARKRAKRWVILWQFWQTVTR